MAVNETKTKIAPRKGIVPALPVILWGLFLEFPLRYFVSPDPWIQSTSHWYFHQPSRSLIELLFVLLALVPFFLVKDLRDLLSIQWDSNHRWFLALGIIGSMVIFGSQQWEEITVIKAENIERQVPIWLLTGLFVGIGQELTFRGSILTGILDNYGERMAIGLSTLCFALGSIHSIRLFTYLQHGHLFETILLLSVYIISGLFFAWVRIRTRNVIIPSIIHGIGNAITWATFIVVKLHT